MKWGKVSYIQGFIDDYCPVYVNEWVDGWIYGLLVTASDMFNNRI